MLILFKVALPFSSGTTGVSKGVMLTHYNLTSALTVILNDDVFPDREKTIFLTLMPFYHIYALLVMLGAALRIGSKQVLLSRFEPNPFLKAIQDYKV